MVNTNDGDHVINCNWQGETFSSTVDTERLLDVPWRLLFQRLLKTINTRPTRAIL